MDVRYINPFVDAVCTVFREMLEVEVLLGSPHLRAKDRPSADVSAIFGFAGEEMGSVAICMSRRTALIAAITIHGADVSTDNTAFVQALSGLANRIAEQTRINLGGCHVSLCLPRVVVGDRHQIVEPNETAAFSLPCDASFGRFSIEAAVLRNEGSDAEAAEAAVAGTS